MTDAKLMLADLGGSVFDWAWLVRTGLRHAKPEGINIAIPLINHPLAMPAMMQVERSTPLPDETLSRVEGLYRLLATS